MGVDLFLCITLQVTKMKTVFSKSIFFTLLLFLLILLPACWPWGAQKQKGLVVINVLDKELYDDCHIKGSINVPITDIESYAQERIDNAADIVLYCSNYFCGSSSFAREKLVKLGFKSVWVYEGGTAEWFQLNYPVDGPAKSPYLSKKIMVPEHQEDFMVSAETLKKMIEEAKKN